MPITQADRKLLWARSANRCSMCRRPLTADAESAELSGLIFGQEAHIIAQAPDGPRGTAESRDNIDSYSNLILLCPEDHKRVDDQTDVYTPARLRSTKAEHEAWVDKTLDGAQTEEPIRVRRAKDEESIPLEPVISGAQLWSIVAEAHMYNFRPLDETHSEAQVDAGDQFLQAAQDWGDIAEDVALSGFKAVRDAQRALKSLLDDLWEVGVFAWGRRLNRTMTGGILGITDWRVAELILLDADDLKDLESENGSGQRLGDP